MVNIFGLRPRIDHPESLLGVFFALVQRVLKCETQQYSKPTKQFPVSIDRFPRGVVREPINR